jgi:hypothetical protein
MRVILRTAKRMGKVLLNGPTEINTLEVGVMVNNMELEYGYHMNKVVV